MKYYYEFKDEKVEIEGIDLIVSFNDEERVCNVIKTNKNILFFDDFTKENVLRIDAVDMLHEYRLIHSELLSDVKITFDEGNTIIITKDNNEIIIHEFILK